MKAPDKIYVASYNGEAFSHSWTMEPLGDTTATEYIRKEIFDETVATAEEHAYFAGQEKFRERLLEWLLFVKSEPRIPMNIEKVIEKVKSL